MYLEISLGSHTLTFPQCEPMTSYGDPIHRHHCGFTDHMMCLQRCVFYVFILGGEMGSTVIMAQVGTSTARGDNGGDEELPTTANPGPGTHHSNVLEQKPNMLDFP